MNQNQLFLPSPDPERWVLVPKKQNEPEGKVRIHWHSSPIDLPPDFDPLEALNAMIKKIDGDLKKLRSKLKGKRVR